MEGDSGEEGRQEVANWVEADGEGQADHGGDEAGTQHAAAAAVARVAVVTIGVGIQAGIDHCHALDVLDVAQQNNKAKEDGKGGKPANKDG